MKKIYKITYKSPCNAFQGEVFTEQPNNSTAMGEFFGWIKKQSVWTHLWQINISIEEVEKAQWI